MRVIKKDKYVLILTTCAAFALVKKQLSAADHQNNSITVFKISIFAKLNVMVTA